MKKKIVLALVVILAIATVLFTGCAKGEKALTKLQTNYDSAKQAKKIEVNIENKQNSLIQYTSKTVYTKAGSGYSWTRTTQTIQHIDDSLLDNLPENYDGYNYETTGGVATNASEFLPTLKLEAQYLDEYKASNKSLNAQVRGGSEAAFLGLDDPLVPTPSDMTVTMTFKKKQVTSLVISFVSDEVNITISYAFTY